MFVSIDRRRGIPSDRDGGVLRMSEILPHVLAELRLAQDSPQKEDTARTPRPLGETGSRGGARRGQLVGSRGA